MSGWTTHTGRAVGLPMENIDTDQLIPARFMSTPRSEGYGKYLLHDLRYDADGKARDFPLFEGASVLIAGRNFGGGSSREAAVYALIDFGIRAVVAPSFGDIFASNAINSGLLPARVEASTVDTLLRLSATGDADAQIDLETCTLSVGDVTTPFNLDPVWRQKLINGWDDIDLTEGHSGDITAFRKIYMATFPWAAPGPGLG